MSLNKQNSTLAKLSSEEKERYQRQLLIWGIEDQLKLKESAVLVVGVGGLGSSIAIYLTAVGIGKLILVDGEVVELSNLNRQVLYSVDDIGKPKVYVAAEKLRKLNPHVKIEPVKTRLTEKLAEELVPKADVIVDALDNWETRLILNRVCVKHRKPLIHGGIEAWYGQVMTIIPGKTPCLQCLVPTLPRSRKAPLPVMPMTPGIIGLIEANEVVKLLLGKGELLLNRMLVYDGFRGEFTFIKVSRNPNCPVCSMIRN